MYSRALAMMLSLFAAAAVAEEGAVEFKGYYKNLYASSHTVFPRNEHYTLDLNRLRIEARGQPAEWMSFEVQYDNEVFLGSYLDTAQFHHQKHASPTTYWDLEEDYTDRGSIYGRHRVHRGYVTLKSTTIDAHIGRQRIAWGTGRFWNPTDLFNPFNPIQLEREERMGVDAVQVETNVGPLSKLSAVHAAYADDSSTALRFRANRADTDYAVMGGRFQGDDVVGFDLAGRIGQAGWRAEATRTHTANDNRYTRAVAGLEYAFQNSLTLSAEYYYNGAGATEKAQYDFTRLFTGKIQNVARHYVGAYAKYELTPLLRWDNYLIVNLDDHSRFFAPALVYSVTAGLDWTVGVQLFNGSGGSEYGAFHDVYYTTLQWFF